MRPTGRLLTIAGNALFTLVVLAMGAVIVGLTILPTVMRYQAYVVLSGSMEPNIHTGSVVVSTAVDPSTLKVGDVITFIRPGDSESVTHRIIQIKGSTQGKSFVTKGDANQSADPGEIKFDRLAGKVALTIPLAGYFFKFVGSPTMRILFIVVPGALLLGSWLWDVWKPKSKAQASGAAPEQPVSGSNNTAATGADGVSGSLQSEAVVAPVR